MAGSGHGRRCGAVFVQPIIAIDSSLNYTVFYFLQSYFTLPPAILTAFLDLLVATAQMMTERIRNFPGNHSCFEKPRAKQDGAPAPANGI
jgi:hypothetical protein